MKGLRTRAAIGAALAAALAGPAGAQDSSVAEIKKQVAENDGIFGFDYGTPASAALNLAGLSPDKTTTASTFKPFIISLPALFNGADGETAALDVGPAWLFGQAQKQTIDAYQASRALRTLDRIRFSLAGTNGDSAGGEVKKQKPSRLAVGFSTSLLDWSDPLMIPAVAKGGPYPDEYSACLATIAHRGARSRTVNVLNAPYGRYSKLLGRLEVPGAVPDAADTATLQALFGPPAAPAAKPKAPELDRRAIAAAQYLRELAESQNWEAAAKADLARVEQRVNAPALVDPPIPAAAAGTLTLEQVAAYRTKLAKLVDDTQSANDTLAEAVSTDLGIMEAAKGCAQHVSQLAMYRTQANIGAGLLWRGDPGHFRDFERGGGAVWLGVRQPLAVIFGEKAGADGKGPLRYWMLGASVRRGWDEALETGDDTTPTFRADTWDVWGGIEHLTTWNQFAVQLGYLEANARSATDAAFSRSGMRWLISDKVRISSASSGIWAGLSYGQANGNSDKLKDETLLFSITFGPPEAPNLFKEVPATK